jgi:hypothetical protein
MNFWGSIDNRRQFFEWAETQLGIKQPSDWYQISSRQLRKINGSQKKASLSNALSNDTLQRPAL